MKSHKATAKATKSKLEPVTVVITAQRDLKALHECMAAHGDRRAATTARSAIRFHCMEVKRVRQELANAGGAR